MDSEKSNAQSSIEPKIPPLMGPNFGSKNFFSQQPPNYSSTHPTYMNHVQQYAQNRMQQQIMEGGFFRPPNFNNQSPPSLFNKPIRFNINKQGTKVNPLMMRLQQQQHQQQQQQNPYNNNNNQMNNFQNSNAKKRKNKKKKNKNNNNSNNNNPQNNYNSYNVGNNQDSLPQPPLPPTINFTTPPPPLPQDFQKGNNADTVVDSSSNGEPSNNANDSENKPAMDWPQSLYNYVARCYMKCTSPLDKDMVEITLKGKITMAANRNELFTKDWDNEPLPVLHSESFQNSQQQQQQQLPKQPAKHIFNKNVVSGNLAKYQNQPTSSSKRNSANEKYGKSSKKRRSSSSSSRSSSPVKRRRSNDSDDDVSPVKPNKNNKKGKKEKQSAFYSKFGAAHMGGTFDSADSERLKKRADRFNVKSNKVQPTASTTSYQTSAKKRLSLPTFFSVVDDSSVDDGLDLMNLHIVGTCRDLEKSFLRLTKAPDASEVRPKDVLIYSLTNVKNKWVEKQDYYYTCDQLKSIRQDLTVQGIRDDFTIKVYETHAR